MASPLMPKFTLIIPVYNVEAYLGECLDSVLAQTFTDWEAVCVDDGSTDSSGAILDRYAATDARFKVVHKENGGVSSARNAALDLARGEWVAFADGDDVLSSDWLRVADEMSKTGDVDFLRLGYTTCRQFPAQGMIPERRDFKGESLLLNVLPACLREGYSFLLFLRGDVARKVRFREGVRIKEDNVFCADALRLVRKAAMVDYKGYYYRRREGSAVTSRRTADDMQRLVDEWRRIRKEYAESHYSGRVLSTLKERVCEFMLNDAIETVLSLGLFARFETSRVRQTYIDFLKDGYRYVKNVPARYWTPATFAFVHLRLAFPIHAVHALLLLRRRLIGRR